jgi:hypothetical protein
VSNPAGAVESDDRAHHNASRRVEADPDAAQDFEQFLRDPDGGAAPGQVFAGALEHRHIPADRTQQVGGEQPADRPADDERAWCGGH